MNWRLRAAIVAGALSVTACGARAPARELQGVTPAGGGRYWATGSGGRAVFFDGSRLEARDYPMDDAKPPWSYEPGYGFPATQLRVIGGRSWLFSRGGDVLSWTSAGWSSHAVEFPSERAGDPPQLDQVLVLPGDELFVHLHAHTLLRARLPDLLVGRYELERTPSFFTQMTVADGRAIAIGWDSSGEVRALYASLPRRGFSLLGRLGVEEPSSEMLAPLVLADGTPGAVAHAGVIALGKSAELDALREFVPVLASEITSISAANSRAYVSAAYSHGRDGALFVLAGSDARHDVVAMDRGAARGYRCVEPVRSTIGAFPHEGGWRIVDREGGFRDVPGTSCRTDAQLAR